MMPAGVGRPGFRVGMGVFGDHQRIEFSDHGDCWAWTSASGYAPFQTGYSQAALMLDAHLLELLGDQLGGLGLPEPGFGGGQYLLRDANDLFLVLLDGLACAFFQLIYRKGR